MGSMVVIFALTAFVLGAGTLALAFGYKSIEEERAKEEARTRQRADTALASAVLLTPRFLAQPGTASRRRQEKVDDAVVANIESYLAAEQALAEKFVCDPSLDNLYRDTGRLPVN